MFCGLQDSSLLITPTPTLQHIGLTDCLVFHLNDNWCVSVYNEDLKRLNSCWQIRGRALTGCVWAPDVSRHIAHGQSCAFIRHTEIRMKQTQQHPHTTCRTGIYAHTSLAHGRHVSDWLSLPEEVAWRPHRAHCTPRSHTARTSIKLSIHTPSLCSFCFSSCLPLSPPCHHCLPLHITS